MNYIYKVDVFFVVIKYDLFNVGFKKNVFPISKNGTHFLVKILNIVSTDWKENINTKDVPIYVFFSFFSFFFFFFFIQVCIYVLLTRHYIKHLESTRHKCIKNLYFSLCLVSKLIMHLCSTLMT